MKHRMLRLGILLAGTALLATAGCIPGLPGLPGVGEPDIEPPLEGNSWVLEHYGEPGNPTPALAGSYEVTLEFGDGELSGSAGCNSYFGSYTSKKDGTFEVSDLANTEMACMEPGVMEQEGEYLTALRLAENYEVNGSTLRIVGGGKLLVLARSEEAPGPAEQPPLKDTSWVLDAYGTPGNLTPAISGREPTIDFATGELNGSAGCNSYFGSYTSDTDGSLEISDVGSTAMYCMEEDVRDQEQAFLEALAAANKYEVVAGKLRITGAGKVLWFTHE